MQYLPPSLKKLDFVHVDLDPEVIFASALHLTSLESLTIQNWSAAHFHVLPRTITNLSLSKLQNISWWVGAASQFAKLPLLLKSLFIESKGPLELDAKVFAPFRNLKYLEINGADPRLPPLTVARFWNACCYPDLRISRLPFPESYLRGDLVSNAVPTNALNSPIWSHLDNQTQNPNLCLKSIIPSHWPPSIVDAANAIDCCMIEADDTTRHAVMQLINDSLTSDSLQSRFLELCLTPHWTVRKLGIAICLLEYENSAILAAR